MMGENKNVSSCCLNEDSDGGLFHISGLATWNLERAVVIGDKSTTRYQQDFIVN
jgi:hypothetical protein